MKNNLKKIFKKLINTFKDNKLFSIFLLLVLLELLVFRFLTNGNIFATKAIISDLGVFFLISCFAFTKNKIKNHYLYLQIWLSFITIVYIINAIYYSFYSSFSSITELGALGQAKTVAGSFFERLSPLHFIYLIGPIIFHLYYKKYYRKYSKDYSSSKSTKKYILKLSLIFLGISLVTSNVQDFSRLYKQWNRTYIVDRFGILIYQTTDLISSSTSKLTTIFGFDKALTETTEFYKKNTKYKETNKYTDMFSDSNIIFVHMESIQSFLLDKEFNGKKVLPTTNKLIEEGMYFSNFYPQISTGTSSDTEFTLLSSLLPTRIGIVFNKYYDRNYVTIPKLLNEKDYYTFSMHGNDFTMWNRNNAHPSLGYKNYYFKDKYTFTEDDVVNLGIKDSVFFKQSIKYLEDIEKNNNQYMGTVITLSNHSPFNYLDKYANFDLSKEYTVYNKKTKRKEKTKIDYLTGTNIGNYILSSHSADLDLGIFIDLINNSDYFNNTIFVFYGDHDARLSKNQFNYFYNYDPINEELLDEDNPNYFDYNEYEHCLNKKTPLIIWSKNEQVRNLIKGTYSYPMGMIDIFPTIGNMIGIKNKYALGTDIFNIKDKNVVVFPNGDFVTNSYYYMSSKDQIYKINNDYIDKNNIKKNKKYSEERIDISNNIVIHDILNYIK